jgi:hypothetical protein
MRAQPPAAHQIGQLHGVVHDLGVIGVCLGGVAGGRSVLRCTRCAVSMRCTVLEGMHVGGGV